MAGTATISWIGNPAGGGGWTGSTTNLTHRWSLEDANISGTTVTDVIGSLNGTSSPAALSSVAGPGSHTARSFNGTSETIALASSPLPAITSPHSLFMWVYADSTGSLSTVFGDFQSAGNAVRFAVDIDGSLTAAGALIVKIDRSSVAFDHSSDAAPDRITLNSWQHVGYTWDGTSATVIYLNGSAISSTGGSGAGSVGSGHTLGSRGDGSGFLKGRMYNAVVYSAVLSGAEVSALYTAQ